MRKLLFVLFVTLPISFSAFYFCFVHAETCAKQPIPFPAQTSLIPSKISAKAGKPIVIDASTSKSKVKWRCDFDSSYVVQDGKRLIFASPYNGTYRVLALTIGDSGDILDATCDITVTGGVPMPDVPPPDITDDPLLKLTNEIAAQGKLIKAMMADIAELKKAPRPPPVPVDPPKPPLPAAPFESPNGLSVLIVYDSAVALPSEQQKIITGKEFRDYLNAKCAVSPDGKKREYNIWPVDADTTNAQSNFRKAFALPHQSVPWIHLSNGKTGYSGVLPGSVADTIALITKYEVK